MNAYSILCFLYVYTFFFCCFFYCFFCFWEGCSIFFFPSISSSLYFICIFTFILFSFSLVYFLFPQLIHPFIQTSRH